MYATSWVEIIFSIMNKSKVVFAHLALLGMFYIKLHTNNFAVVAHIRKLRNSTYNHAYLFLLLGFNPSTDLPVDFNISGDPSKDASIDLHLLTADRIYKMQLKRLEHNILHEDVRLLTISVDSTGKTIFKEQLKPVSI